MNAAAVKTAPKTVRPKSKPPTKATRAPRSPKPSAKPQASPQTKIDIVIAALSKQKGATITDLMTLTGWQMHSVRGAIAGSLKKKRGLVISSTKNNGERVYRIEGAGT
ncbi:MAG: DUF3489 domain-containing protein [Caulobacterales bacterium]